MSEVYLGPELDQKYIAEYLANIRRLDPIEISTLANPIRLSDTDRLVEIVDVDKFWEIANKFLIDFERQCFALCIEVLYGKAIGPRGHFYLWKLET